MARGNTEGAMTGRRRLGRWLFALGLSLLVLPACAEELQPATAVAVSIKTDLMVGSELTEITCRVFDIEADPQTATPASQHTSVADALERPFVITKGRASEFMLSVEGSRAQGQPPIVVARVRVRFEEGKTLALPIFLARACSGRSCQFPGLTCFGQSVGNVPAGQCAAIPGPDVLREIHNPGEESAWTPMPVRPLDASFLPIPLRDAGSASHPDASNRSGI
jgi:hypothetical protein